jgi:multimeric flavodoxin WrbA
MNVLAFNASPMMDKGNTALILDPFLEGMREAGAEVELYYTKKLKVNPCHGEFNCWVKTPGKCYQKDDMEQLVPALRAADVWVLATPVFVDGMTGPLKSLLDRMIPLLQPFVELRDGHCRHPLGEGSKKGKIALVSNCGFWEMDNFDPLLVHLEAICRNSDRDFAGALLRPHGPALRVMLKRGFPVKDVLEAAKEAGRQLVQDGEMAAQTLGTVSRELMPMGVYVENLNRRFQQALAR